ncbi:MAG TPA: UpxY family transcription antiterminator [Terriglobales bacterium]|nr:UpxY family transcription antiterminator [Terriglobales bacterium]
MQQLETQPTMPSLCCGDERWYAVKTKPRHEKKVALDLDAKGITTFLPLHATVRQWSDRKQTVELPLFANYIFTKIAPEHGSRVPVLRTMGVLGFVGSQGMGTPIPEEQIAAVQAILQQRVPFNHSPFMNIGQTVRIRGGSLDGVTGILLAQNGDRSLLVSIELIQRSLAIRVEGYRVEPA